MRRAWLILMVVAATGCGVSKDDLVGSWSGSMTISETALDDAVKQVKAAGGGDVSREKLRSSVEDSTSILRLHEDGTFAFNVGFGAYTGTWEYQSKVVTLKTESVNGIPLSQLAAFEVEQDMIDRLQKPIQLNVLNGKELEGGTPEGSGSAVKLFKTT